MLRMILAQLHRKLGRATALFLGILVATTGFTVLTGSSESSRLEVTGAVQANFRSAYDILVRPTSARTPLEEQRGLVRPNFLSGQFGGITMSQYEQIRRIPGIEAAAPIAMIGYVPASGSVSVDVTDLVDPRLTRQVLRVRLTWTAAHGLTALNNDVPRYVYVTTHQVVWPVLAEGQPELRWSDGKARPHMAPLCGSRPFPIEIREDGTELALCQIADEGVVGPLGGREYRSMLDVAQLKSDGSFVTGYKQSGEAVSDRLVRRVDWPLSLLLAAIDPAAEADLVGLDAAVTTGRYLDPDDKPVNLDSSAMVAVPVLTTTHAFLDEGLIATPELLTGPAVDDLAGRDWSEAQAALDIASGISTRASSEFASQDAYVDISAAQPGTQIASLHPIVQSGEVRYAEVDGVLRPQQVPTDPSVFVDPHHAVLNTSWLVADEGFRPLQQVPLPSQRFPFAETVGTFDPRKLPGFSELSTVPLETYFPPRATGADERSRRLLEGQALEPDSNPAGYLATPPLMLTSLSGFPGLASSPAPLSAVRIRVAGVHGVDEVSLERVRAVAEMVATRTGLDVDITLGSSPAPQMVQLPAGKFGRPDLLLTEEWSQKGVATFILQAIDRKSVILFGLILVVCVLFLANGVSAAVRDRRKELAVLACLGWPRLRLGALVASEVGIVAVCAGIASAALAIPLSRVVAVQLNAPQAVLAIPIALVVAISAAIVPALLAARTHPGISVRETVRPSGRRRVWAGRSPVALALTNMSRVRGRTMLAVAALAIGVAAATVVAAITSSFHGSITGSLLGDAVSVQVRGVDVVSVAATIALGLAAVADVLYLNVRQRANELAILRATGWSATALARLVIYEGIGIGMLGSVLGAVVGVVGAATFAGEAPAGFGWLLLASVAAATVLAGLASLVPALLQLRMPLSILLAEE